MGEIDKADARDVGVKPLVWVPEDAPCTRFKAEALGGHMMIVELDPKTDPGRYSVGFDLGGLCFKFVLAWYDDFPPKYTAPAKFDGIEAAKAAAHADYTARILSALHPASPLGAVMEVPEVRAQSDAMQAAVAKAVEASVNAENEACAKMLDNEADDYEADASRFRGGTDPHHFRMNLASTARKYAAAIRARKGDAL